MSERETRQPNLLEKLGRERLFKYGRFLGVPLRGPSTQEVIVAATDLNLDSEEFGRLLNGMSWYYKNRHTSLYGGEIKGRNLTKEEEMQIHEAMIQRLPEYSGEDKEFLLGKLVQFRDFDRRRFERRVTDDQQIENILVQAVNNGELNVKFLWRSFGVNVLTRVHPKLLADEMMVIDKAESQHPDRFYIIELLSQVLKQSPEVFADADSTVFDKALAVFIKIQPILQIRRDKSYEHSDWPGQRDREHARKYLPQLAQSVRTLLKNLINTGKASLNVIPMLDRAQPYIDDYYFEKSLSDPDSIQSIYSHAISLAESNDCIPFLLQALASSVIVRENKPYEEEEKELVDEGSEDTTEYGYNTDTYWYDHYRRTYRKFRQMRAYRVRLPFAELAKERLVQISMQFSDAEEKAEVMKAIEEFERDKQMVVKGYHYDYDRSSVYLGRSAD